MSHRTTIKPASLPKLRADGSNYHNWKTAWSVALRVAKLHDNIKLESTNTEISATVKKENEDETLILLFQAVDEELMTFTTSYDNPAQLWKAFADRFDRDTSLNNIYLLRSLLEARMEDGDSILDHINHFNEKWRKISVRCTSSTSKLAISMKSIFQSDEIKGQFFLASLPDTESYRNKIDNFTTKDIVKYVDIESRLLDDATNHQRPDEVAYYTKTAGKFRRGHGNAHQTQDSSGYDNAASGKDGMSNQVDICSWCQKFGYHARGHTSRICRRLRKHQETHENSTTNKWARTANNAGQTDTEYECHTSDSDEPIALMVYNAVDNAESESNSDADEAFIAYNVTQENAHWIFDTGCTIHLSSYKEDFVTLKKKVGKVKVAGGQVYPYEGMGDIQLQTRMSDNSSRAVVLKKAIYIPAMRHTRLFSWMQACKMGCEMRSNGKDIVVEMVRSTHSGKISRREVMWAQGKSQGFVIATCQQTRESGQHRQQVKMHTAMGVVSYNELHSRMGHLSNIHNSCFTDNELPSKPANFDCSICRRGKSVHSIPKSNPQLLSSGPLQVIHTDLSSRMLTSLGGKEYYISLIDEWTRYTWVYFLGKKSDTPVVLKEFIAMASRQFDIKIKRIVSDRGGEYIDQGQLAMWKKDGIIFDPRPAYAHESNGLAERMNRTIADVGRCILMQNDMPQYLWAEAVATSVYIKNRHSSSPTDTTPYEKLYGRKPSVAHMRVFGQKCYVHIPKEKRNPQSKFQPRAQVARFVGYGTSTKFYRVYVQGKRTVKEVRDISFAPFTSKSMQIESSTDLDTGSERTGGRGEEESDHKDEQLNQGQAQEEDTGKGAEHEDEQRGHSEPKGEYSESDTGSNLNEPDAPGQRQQSAPPVARPTTPPPRRSTRESKGRPPKRFDDETESSAKKKTPKVGSLRENPLHKAKQVVESNLPMVACNVDQVDSPDIPRNFSEMQKSSECHLWMEAVQTETDALAKNDVLEYVSKRDVANLREVGSRWVCAKKHHPDGALHIHKVRLVAQGFSQIPGQDYTETYAPVAKYDSLRLLLTLAARNSWPMEQCDVVTAFLHGKIEEVVHMRIPEGYERFHHPPGPRCEYTLRVHKCLYGLKQSGRGWYLRFLEIAVESGFQQSSFDPCLLLNKDGPFYILLWVDDMILTGVGSMMDVVKKGLGSKLSMKFLGPVKYLLGMELVKKEKGFVLTQRGYAKRVVERFGMADCNPISTPLEMVETRRATAEETPQEQNLYQQMTGSIQHLVVGTRPDLAFAAGVLGRYNSNPQKRHHALAKRVLRYIKGTVNLGILFAWPADMEFQDTQRTKSDINDAYADASHASDPDTRRSTTGSLLMWNGCIISWASRLQRTVAQSTCEAEYLAMGTAVSNIMWFKMAMRDMGIDATHTLKVDSQSAQALMTNGKTSERTKHIDIKHHYIREKFHAKEFRVEHVASKDNLADILTKQIPRPAFIEVVAYLMTSTPED